MRHEIRFSGFGGQGVILSAVILGRAAAIYDHKYAVQTQVYGPEARGGASMSAVVIDDDPILYPEVENPDIYVIMSQQGYEKYGVWAEPDDLMLVDSDLVFSRPKCECFEIPATHIAKEDLKRVIVANIVMLGATTTATRVVSMDAMEQAVLGSVPRGTEELNMNALNAGFRLGEEIAR